MRKEAIKIYEELINGKNINEIKCNKKTKLKINKIFLYQQLIIFLLDDLIKTRYTLSIPELQKLLKRKKSSR